MGGKVSMPACRAAPFEDGLTHKHQVMRLYRQSMRTAKDWMIDYEPWIIVCERLKAEFKANKNKSLAEGRVLVNKGLNRLLKNRHPDPMIPIYMPGGSKYQRNTPPPPEFEENMMPPPHERIR
mmetsp:Transcript_15240/g.40912  ORF Transcript_15240/g.40912 Transcript_15240/m.40912 type:complete len:123 (-) Transcript_15240:271-639(-)